MTLGKNSKNVLRNFGGVWGGLFTVQHHSDLNSEAGVSVSSYWTLISLDHNCLVCL